MMDGERDGRPALTRLVDNALKGALRERFVRFVHQVQHATSLIVIAHETDERRDGSCRGGVDESNQRRQIELGGRDRRAVEARIDCNREEQGLFTAVGLAPSALVGLGASRSWGLAVRLACSQMPSSC